MAETEERSLDNFFAKRDKKKKKERSSRAASAAGAAGNAGGSSGTAGGGPGAGTRPGDGGTAGTGSRPGDGGTAGTGATGPGAATKAVTKDEDEWKEFEQKEVDYSGLRVQAMQISEKEEDDNEKREDPGDNWEEGGGGGGIEKSSGPWNKTAPVQAPPTPVVVTETPEPAMTSGVYRPPGARLTTTRKTPQGPPEIYSDTQFPSLQSTAKHVESRKDKEMEKNFEVVRHKNRGRDEVSKNQALKLQLDNQYAVLENQKSSHTQYN
ncbi:protein CDV3 homolog isoform X1 [Marmota flaviventris]|uniref:protein CDV3 homolog isoform X1 n=1 Tax=Marmota flaviventris TaxID=93162 RepID=UPI000FFFB176|nr:protein CDV3 homolog isoform X2 [Marmota flaviventris]